MTGTRSVAKIVSLIEPLISALCSFVAGRLLPIEFGLWPIPLKKSAAATRTSNISKNESQNPGCADD